MNSIRRAVLLPSGGLGERALHPDLPESRAVSLVLADLRRARGEVVYPLDTRELLELAVETNAAGAWEALKDDVVTGDFDADHVLADQVSRALACLARPPSTKAGAQIVWVLSKVAERAPAAFPAAQLRGLLNPVLRLAGGVPRDRRAGLLDAMAHVCRDVGAEFVADAIDRQPGYVEVLYLADMSRVSAARLVDYAFTRRATDRRASLVALGGCTLAADDVRRLVLDTLTAEALPARVVVAACDLAVTLHDDFVTALARVAARACSSTHAGGASSGGVGTAS